MDKFIAWLKNEMDSRELGINQLGLLSGVSPSHLSNILNGKRGASPRTVNLLAKFFKADADYLLELAGYRSQLAPEKEFKKVKDQELRFWLDVDKLNNLSPKTRKLIATLIKEDLEERGLG
jgi:transcriptional regulator with XRE-family HTH domain